MRTIRVTGGFSDYAVGVLEEVNREPLALTDLRLALVGDGAPLPDRASEQWRTPDEATFPAPHRARLSLLVDDKVTPGSYYLWALPIDNPTATPVKASNHMIVVT